MTENEIKSLLGQNLKALRKESGMSQMQLAEKVGVTFNFINDIENGKKWISPATLSKLCSAFDVQPYQFFTSVQSMQITPDRKPEDEVLAMFSSDILNQMNAVIQKTIERYRK